MQDENADVIILKVFHKPENCINCGGKVVPIIYGEPSPELMDEFKSGEVILGGCCFLEESPDWGCLDCEAGYIDFLGVSLL